MELGGFASFVQPKDLSTCYFKKSNYKFEHLQEEIQKSVHCNPEIHKYNIIIKMQTSHYTWKSSLLMSFITIHSIFVTIAHGVFVD